MNRLKPLLSRAFLLLVLSTLVLSSCGDDDEPENDCTLPTIDGTVNWNNESLTLTSATLQVLDGFGDVSYTFAIGALSSDCTTQNSVSLTVETSGDVTGTYDITDFFDAGAGDAFGVVTNQQLQPLSQTQEELASGTLELTEGTENNFFTIDLDALTITGEEVKLTMSHQF